MVQSRRPGAGADPGAVGLPSTSDTGSQTSQWLSNNEKALIGGLGAATAGGLLGAAFHLGPAGIIGGALLGGLAGGAIGNRMDAADKQQQAQAAQKAFETTPSGRRPLAQPGHRQQWRR